MTAIIKKEKRIFAFIAAVLLCFAMSGTLTASAICADSGYDVEIHGIKVLGIDTDNEDSDKRICIFMKNVEMSNVEVLKLSDDKLNSKIEEGMAIEYKTFKHEKLEPGYFEVEVTNLFKIKEEAEALMLKKTGEVEVPIAFNVRNIVTNEKTAVDKKNVFSFSGWPCVKIRSAVSGADAGRVNISVKEIKTSKRRDISGDVNRFEGRTDDATYGEYNADNGGNSKGDDAVADKDKTTASKWSGGAAEGGAVVSTEHDNNSLIMMTAALSGIAALAFSVSIVPDIRVIRWYNRKKAERLANTKR